MVETARLMSFEEFRAAQPMAEVVRQQRAFFRDAAAAEQALRLALLSVLVWVMWKDPDGGVV
ncbi:MAG TPA: hypothetical protein VMU84_02605 [Thermoanaerobaculia bacterium]|nr:hypothetical protein [Thermoanaerobaculia bacterium]